MLKKLIIVLLSLPLVLALLVVVLTGVAIQQGVASRSDIAFLVDLGRRNGLGAVISTIRAEVYGIDPDAVTDPSYGRERVAGRGHAPWVIRSNLDGRPRMLNFALAPQLWAAYDTERASLYQVWAGEVLFEGSTYDYRHGPQPSSSGAWYQRDTGGAQWFLEVDGEELPAEVRYLGHEYGPGRKTAALRFAVLAGGHRVELTEWPEISAGEGAGFLLRRFQREDGDADIVAGFRTGSGERHLAQHTVPVPLGEVTEIPPPPEVDTGTSAASEELAAGQAVIANSDCLGCHGETHRIAGPAWSQVAGKFRGKTQGEVVEALANHVRNGAVGTWGTVPMPPHPDLTLEQARAAVTYILSVPAQEDDPAPPTDAAGNPYAASWDYDVLPRPSGLHPSLRLENLTPDGFEPKVGGMDFRADGKLVLASWDADGAVFLVDPEAPAEQRVRRIAEGLHEPLGLTIVDGRTYVLQKQELTELIDTDSDGIIDRYRAVSYDWPSSSNFHSFAFGLLHRDDGFYFLLSICVLPGGASCPEQLPTQGKLLRADADDGKVEVVASGLRTPNGIGPGPGDAIYITDNQGDWLPASKLVEVRPGEFYGSRAVPDTDIMTRVETPPAVWLPQDEVGNSPTQPLLLQSGPYAGQMLHGDVYNGGIKRVFLEEVNGRKQGAAFHFSAGFQSSINRLTPGPDGAIYLGEIGSRPNWGEYGKPWYGLQRMYWTQERAFEMQSVEAQPDGFVLRLTEPLDAKTTLTPADLRVQQWFYHPTEQYGGPKYDVGTLTASQLELSPDRRSIRARIPGLKPGYVVYLRLDDRLRSASGQDLWTAEAWYTLNAIPDKEQTPLTTTVQPATVQSATAQAADGDDGQWRVLFDGNSLDGWRNYGGAAGDVRKWIVQDGTLALQQEGIFPLWDLIASVIFGGGSTDIMYAGEKFRNFELSLEWKISKNGNSGIFYLVADETENTPWLTGVEMQVLDNDGHADGKITTHRAGDLYDLIAADPETVLPPGEWNQVRIRIKDNHIEHWLNGVKVVSVERGGEQWNALVAASKFADMPRFGQSDEGYIVLQDHGDPVWYRNIRVRDL